MMLFQRELHHFEQKKELSFDDLLMTTRKKPENKQKISLSLSCLYVYIYAEFTNEASNITVKGLDFTICMIYTL